MKKLLAVFACGALAFVCTAQPINAAVGINPSEAELLDLIEEGVSFGEGFINYAPGSEEYEVLSQYLEQADIDLDAAALTTIKDSVKNAQAFMTTYGEEVATPELMAQLFDLITPAAKALNLNLTYNPLTDGLLITDKNGTIIFNEENIFELGPIASATVTEAVKLENTGEDFTSTYAIVGSLVAMLACAGYMTLKKKETLN